MSRPDLLAFRRLPVLEARRTELETCVYCPKLCRAVCPVSNAEPTETLTPWGKMSMAYFVANESVEAAESYAKPAWGCTGCQACAKNACDHKNDVRGTLYEARAALTGAGLAPEGALRAKARFPKHVEGAERAATELFGAPREGHLRGRTALVVGCSYLTKTPEEARTARAVASELAGCEVDVVRGCCGAPLLAAGDREGFDAQAASFAKKLDGYDEVLVVDAGCGATILRDYAARSVATKNVELLVVRARRELARFRTVGAGGESVRYHDPCELSRGLGVVEQPRALLEKILGQAPLEFERSREKSVCSGGGGLLPVTMPDVAKRIASERVAIHDERGGGTIVTACASSLRSFRRAGAKADDLVTWLARGLGIAGDGARG